MKYIIVLFLFAGVANASPFYFQTTLGSAGSFGRGLGHETGSIALGAEIFKTDRFAIDLEAGYTQISSNKGKKTVQETIWYEVDVPTIPDPEPIVVVEAPVIEPPTIPEPEDTIVVIDAPITPPLTYQNPPGSDETVISHDPLPDEPEVEEPPIVEIDIGLPFRRIVPQGAGKIEGVRINGKEIKEFMPKFSTDLYQATAGARLKIGNFMWIQLRAGAEKKVIDGQIEEKTKKGELINWRTKEKFRDDEVTYILGGAALFNLRKQLMGVVKFDYHDLNNSVNDSDFQTDDIIVSAGLRFGF